jgi:hypothetical protein
MTQPTLPPRKLPKRFCALQLLAYLCPALVIWAHASPEEVSRIVPIVLAFSYELARARRSLALGDNALIINGMDAAINETSDVLRYLSEIDSAMDAVKEDIKIRKKAEFARKKAIKNPCTVPNCKNKATYAYRYGEADRCEGHRDDRKKQYRVCTCGKAQPSYNLPGETSAAYCVSCKSEDMVNIVSKRCACNSRQPSFNYPDDDTPVCCIQCKAPDMIHVGREKCQCGKAVPKFAEIGESKAGFCKDCKTETMINIGNQLCLICKSSYALYNSLSERNPAYCVKCKLQNMVKVSLRYCPGADGTCTSYRNSKFRGFCAHCFVNIFPNDPLTFTIRQKSKENRVRAFINSTFEGFTHNRPLSTTHCDCTVRRRLDHYKIIGNTVLAIETDENQHKSYDQMNEEMRYNDLYMAFSGRWVYIRFNPDRYTDENGATCDPSMPDRLAALGEEIAHQIARITARGNIAITPDTEEKDLVEIIYMYYDECV